MDHWVFLGLSALMLTCWLTGEILAKARFRPDIPQIFAWRAHALGWVSLRTSGVLALVIASNQHLQCLDLRADLQRARAQRGIVEQVDHRMTAARPGFEITDPASGVVVQWHPPNETAVTDWRSH